MSKQLFFDYMSDDVRKIDSDNVKECLYYCNICKDQKSRFFSDMEAHLRTIHQHYSPKTAIRNAKSRD